jgi:hypothetical protein
MVLHPSLDFQSIGMEQGKQKSTGQDDNPRQLEKSKNNAHNWGFSLYTQVIW